MQLLQAILYITAVVLIVLAALGVTVRISLALLGAGLALLAYALPTITAAI
jgi:hypothetical protein